jgi:hypothetical protein
MKTIQSSACYFCSNPITNLTRVTYSTRGHPVCEPCRQELDRIASERQQSDIKALFSVVDVRESRSTDLVRMPRVNIHD